MKILCQNKQFSVIYDIHTLCYSPVGNYAQTLLTQSFPFYVWMQPLNCLSEVVLRAQNPLTFPSNEEKTQKLPTSAWGLRTLSVSCDRVNTNPFCAFLKLRAQRSGHGHQRQLYTLSKLSHPKQPSDPSILCWQGCPTIRHHSIVWDPSTSSTPTQDAAGGRAPLWQDKDLFLMTFAIPQAAIQCDTSQSFRTPERVQSTVIFKGHTPAGSTGSLGCGEPAQQLNDLL